MFIINTYQKKGNGEVEGKENKTGIPDTMKTNFERSSGLSFDDVNVHYNSDKPAQLNAYAYAQGSDVYVGAGQEKHLPHELGHVVQQKKGDVKPTEQVGDVAINSDRSMEKGADNIAAQAQSTGTTQLAAKNDTATIQAQSQPVAQLEGDGFDWNNFFCGVGGTAIDNVIGIGTTIGTSIFERYNTVKDRANDKIDAILDKADDEYEKAIEISENSDEQPANKKAQLEKIYNKVSRMKKKLDTMKGGDIKEAKAQVNIVLGKINELIQSAAAPAPAPD